MRILVCKDYEEMSKKAAQLIASQVTLKSNSILGLATGSTPIGMYRDLVKMYEKGELDFSNIKTFNLDEYYQLPRDNDQSYYYFMHKNLFNDINIKEENINIPNGMTKDVVSECINYDKAIEDIKGVDIQVLGIGNNAHIGFNEPSNVFIKNTHLVDLKDSTIKANARFFESIEDVPQKAVTMGIGSILAAKKILLLASGEGKAEAVYNTVHGEVNPQVPASILQFHNDVTLILDEAAASKLNKDDYELV
ncbi:glucosamine-6-phosphate deaminase [[Clostridium] sordellii]|uniref:glucosamine-6-phosphate deaminase n=1 Tax=Paraclostridium sordellii TaxID=1505 RepID=UPI0005E93D90|nr:glucosamine-6-phosphate deaminase [Paeniclostridium sordellii]CEP88059.1 glucosamine-6-phosphate deaminase [[Clostridium] sordellii] [Paeniclostridium sordellii]